MGLNFRRIYAILVSVMFLIIAPLLVFYATGYRIDFQKRTIIGTGVLTVNTKPNGADVFLNGNNTDRKSPAVIKNLLPGDYDLRFVKNGYFDMEKKLTVYAKKATIFDGIELIKNSVPAAYYPEIVFKSTMSPEKNFIAFLANDDAGEKILAVKRLSDGQEIERIKWLPDYQDGFYFSPFENYLFIPVNANNSDYLVIFLKTQKEPLLLSEISALNYSRIKETGFLPNTAFAINNGGLYLINFDQKTSGLLLQDNIIEYASDDSSLFYVSKTDNGVKLLKSSMDWNNIASSASSDYGLATIKNNSQPQIIADLLSNGEYTLNLNTKGILSVLDRQNKRMLIAESNGSSIMLNRLEPRTVDYRWSYDQNSFLIYNEFEIWTYKPINREQNLIIRTGEEIKSAEWNNNGKWIFFQQGLKIKAIENINQSNANIVDFSQITCDWFDIYPKNNMIFARQPEQQIIYNIATE